LAVLGAAIALAAWSPAALSRDKATPRRALTIVGESRFQRVASLRFSRVQANGVQSAQRTVRPDGVTRSYVGFDPSPDGRLLAFQSEETKQVFVSTSTGTHLQILQLPLEDPPARVVVPTTGATSAWSPDARRLLLVVGPEASQRLVILDLGTGHLVDVTPRGSRGACFDAVAWSPDGSHISFRRSFGPRPDNVFRPARWYCTRGGDYDIATTSGSRLHRLFTAPAGRYASLRASWTPDSKAVVELYVTVTRVIDVRTGADIPLPLGHNVWVAGLPHREIAALTQDGTLQLQTQTYDGTLEGSVPFPPYGEFPVVFSPDFTQLTTAQPLPGSGTRIIDVGVGDGTLRQLFHIPEAWEYGAAFWS
jgi:hypothetical protein